MRRQFKWASFSLIIIVLFGTMAVTVLTAQRQQVNSSLIELSEDAASKLNAGTAPKNVVLGSVDIGDSLAPFTIVFDKSAHAVAGTGYLDGKLPAVPLGVLTSSNSKEYSAVTWQPQGSLRFALITTSANKYYVVSGRSLRIADHSSSITDQITVLGCAASLLILAASYWVCRSKK